MSIHVITRKSDKEPEAPIRRQFATWYAINNAAIHILDLALAFPEGLSYVEEFVKLPDDEKLGYSLSLADPTDHPTGSSSSGPSCGRWTIGAGFQPKLKHNLVPAVVPAVDLLLCPVNSSVSAHIARQSLATTHAQLFFHPESGVLMMESLCAKPLVYVSGNGDSDLMISLSADAARYCVLFQENNYFHLGPYQYSLSFLEFGRAGYAELKKTRDAVMLEQGNFPSRHLDMLPSPQPRLSQDFWFHRLVARDARGEVWSGVRLHDGRPLALKKLKYNRSTADRTARELSIASRFHGQASGMLGMTNCWCEHNETPPCKLTWDFYPKAPITWGEDMYYTMPLAEYDFVSMCWDDMKPEFRVDLLRETLVGLGQLHGCGLMHRAIRPGCLMILRTSAGRRQMQFAAAIGGYYHATPKEFDHGEPPVNGPWVAPEVSNSIKESPYTNKADVWSLALSWVYAFRRPSEEDTEINIAAIEHVRNICEEGEITSRLRDLWVQMLDLDPHARPSVPEALANSAWSSLKGLQGTSKQSDADRKVNKRRRMG